MLAPRSLAVSNSWSSACTDSGIPPCLIHPWSCFADIPESLSDGRRAEAPATWRRPRPVICAALIVALLGFRRFAIRGPRYDSGAGAAH